MARLSNGKIVLIIEEDGNKIIIEDVKRGAAWKLQPSTMQFRRWTDKSIVVPDALVGKLPLKPERLGKVRVTERDGVIETHYTIGNETISFSWKLVNDHVEIVLNAKADSVEFISMPGAFTPVHGKYQVAIPVFQGVLCRGTSYLWESSYDMGGHYCFSMAMGSVLADKGGLLVTLESVDDAVGTRGQNEHGPFFFFEQRKCCVDGWYPRSVRIYPVDNNVNAVCKRYRARVQERGEFMSWEEKIEQKPLLKSIFGCLFAFTGYYKTDQIDYVASAKKLKAYGFENIFYYPVRGCSYVMHEDSRWLSDDELIRLKKIHGTYISPWAHIFEVLETYKDFHGVLRYDSLGKRVPDWKMDGLQWYEVCTAQKIDYMKKRFASDMAAMDWVHYDVEAQQHHNPCLNISHDTHGNKPMNKRQSFEFTARLLSPETNGHRIVASEGFVDRLTNKYDIGSTKLHPQSGDYPFIPVPMTMLVFHDSCIQDWWEVHNYNTHGNEFFCRKWDVGVNGPGQPEKKAAMDALYGCPPNIFAFGKQYGWENYETKKTYYYHVHLEDAEVQRAIRAALPVARLHKKIGMSELMSFDFVTEDYAVQSTSFSDGTRIIANISDADKEVEGHGLLKANSWKEIAK